MVTGIASVEGLADAMIATTRAVVVVVLVVVVDPVVVDADVEVGLPGPVSGPAPATGEFCTTTTVVSAAAEWPRLVIHHIVPPRSATQRAPTVAILERAHPLVFLEDEEV